MKIDIMTLFPETVDAVLHESIIGRAAAKGIVEINCVQIRDYTDNKQNQVDDYPYGAGRTWAHIGGRGKPLPCGGKAPLPKGGCRASLRA